MRVPDSLWSLVDAGVIGEVLRPLLSGKEAEVFLVTTGGEQRVAKVYKEAHLRSFKHRTDYTEGRAGRNSRDRRAIAKRSRHGRAQDEAAWRSAEVEAIYKLRAAGVRVPEPVNYMDGVLVMELVVDADGNPAPRLGELTFEPEEATQIFEHLLQETVRMLCAGVVHADLSDFNILMSADGPVIIDFPQAVDPASNSGARRLLMRDVDNLQDFVGRFAPARRRPYAQEMWRLYESSQLTPETQLSGVFEASRRKTNDKEVLALIEDAKRDEQRRRNRMGEGDGGGGGGRKRGRAPIDPTPSAEPAAAKAEPAGVRGRWVEVKIDQGPERGRRGRGSDAGGSAGARAERVGGRGRGRGQGEPSPGGGGGPGGVGGSGGRGSGGPSRAPGARSESGSARPERGSGRGPNTGDGGGSGRPSGRGPSRTQASGQASVAEASRASGSSAGDASESGAPPRKRRRRRRSRKPGGSRGSDSDHGGDPRTS